MEKSDNVVNLVINKKQSSVNKTPANLLTRPKAKGQMSISHKKKASDFMRQTAEGVYNDTDTRTTPMKFRS